MNTLRPYRCSDWENFLALEVETNRSSSSNVEREPPFEFAGRWSAFLKDRYGWTNDEPTAEGSRITVCDGAAQPYLGHVWLTEKSDFFSAERILFVTAIAVSSSHRRQGIGRLLMSHAFDVARDRGIQCVELGVEASNLAAIRLYQRAGFSVRRHAMRARVDAASAHPAPARFAVVPASGSVRDGDDIE